MFNGKKVKHILPYDSPGSNEETEEQFLDNRKRISISGVQEKFSVVLAKNKLRLSQEGEQGQYILKPIPGFGKNADQVPANEHLTMQIARQVFGIETAENALIFFQNGEPAYLTKRFDWDSESNKLAIEDFASLNGRTPQTHGEDFKYRGSYLDLFTLMQRYLPAYKIEAPKLFRLILFNYLFSNGDAHFKNFSILETPYGDFRLSPAYDLLNTSLHVKDAAFALDEDLLPQNLGGGTVRKQFALLAHEAKLTRSQTDACFDRLLSRSGKVKNLIESSFLHEKAKRSYLQAYQTRYKKLTRS